MPALLERLINPPEAESIQTPALNYKLEYSQQDTLGGPFCKYERRIRIVKFLSRLP
jgi:hypothetical protein